MWERGFIWFICIVSILVFTVCGPGQTTQEAEDQQIQEAVEREKAIYAPLAGKYRGTMTRTDRKTQYYIDMILEAVSIFEPDPERGKRREVPTIRGSIIVYTDKKLKDYVVAIQYNSGYYEPQTGKLFLRGAGIGADPETARDVTFNGTVSGDQITGVSRTSIDPGSLKVSVKRFNEGS